MIEEFIEIEDFYEGPDFFLNAIRKVSGVENWIVNVKFNVFRVIINYDSTVQIINEYQNTLPPYITSLNNFIDSLSKAKKK